MAYRLDFGPQGIHQGVSLIKNIVIMRFRLTRYKHRLLRFVSRWWSQRSLPGGRNPHARA